MNDIYELIDIIAQHNGKADLALICKDYQKNHKIFLSSNHTTVIRETLEKNSQLVYYDQENKMWNLANNKVTNLSSSDFFGFDFSSNQAKEYSKNVRDVINNFKNKYPIEKIESISLNDYMLAPKGKGNDSSFCAMLRYDSQPICSMGNAFPTTFEIYKNSDGNIVLSPTYKKEFNDNYNKAFITLKKRIKEFLVAAGNKDTEQMNKIKINQSFKQKMAVVYFNDLYFPGAVKEYIKQSCIRFGLDFDENNVFNSMIELSKWKNSFPQISNIENCVLMSYADYLIRNDLSMSDVAIENNPYKR